MMGALITFLSRTIARFAHILAVEVPKAPCALSIEAEANDWLIVLERWLRIDQRIATDHHPLADDISAGADKTHRLSHELVDFITEGQMTAACIFQRRACINQLKSQLGGSAEQRFDVFRIVDPRKLNEDPVLALPFDRWLLSSPSHRYADG